MSKRQQTLTSPSMSTSVPNKHCISFNDVLQASKRIKSIVHQTPVLTSSSINTLCDNRQLFFKVEAMQRTGSFKFRGACNATLALLEDREKRRYNNIDDDNDNDSTGNIHIVTHSSGNHAAAVALAAHEVSKILRMKNQTRDQNALKINATIVMPKNAPIIKVNGVKGFGGNIVFVDNTNEAREEMADEIVEKEGATFIHPSENEFVIAGQGTVCLEMVQQVKEMLQNCIDTKYDLDAVIIPVGGGGLASGNTITLRGLLGNHVKVCPLRLFAYLVYSNFS